jgi:hypothetical protein
VGTNGSQEKKLIQYYVLIVNLLTGINLEKRKTRFFRLWITPAYATTHFICQNIKEAILESKLRKWFDEEGIDYKRSEFPYNYPLFVPITDETEGVYAISLITSLQDNGVAIFYELIFDPSFLRQIIHEGISLFENKDLLINVADWRTMDVMSFYKREFNMAFRRVFPNILESDRMYMETARMINCRSLARVTGIKSEGSLTREVERLIAGIPRHTPLGEDELAYF